MFEGGHGLGWFFPIFKGQCLEILIRKLAELFRLPGINANTPLDGVIKALPNYGLVDAKRKAVWGRLRKIRNDCFHKGRLPGLQERKLLIEETGRLESEINIGITTGSHHSEMLK